MAVYQISRIQIRRGQANSGTGIPQLASGEMAWAIDTQELYIGSGAVSEGAPAVTNVKVITQQDLSAAGNILGTVSYTYKSIDNSIITGPSGSSPVLRNINSRLDDQITSLDFGTAGDGATDDTAALQRAINQLFLNASNPASGNTAAASGKRVTLNVPAGIYYTTSTIYIPSYSSVNGAGLDKTIINYNPLQISFTGTSTNGSFLLTTTSASTAMVGYVVTGTGIPNGTTVTTVVPGVSITLSNNATSTLTNGTFTVVNPAPAIQFVNDSSSIGNPDPSVASSTTQCRKVEFKNLTIKTATGVNTCMQINSVRDSIFENINLIGGWTGNTFSIGINMTAVSSLVTCEHNVFRNITASAFNYVVFATNDILNNVFENCYFQNALLGFGLGVGYIYSQTFPNGPRQTVAANCKFYNIKQQAIYVAAGSGNIARDCRLNNVGNNGGSNAASQYAQIYFATYGNSSENTQSDRHSDLSNPDPIANPTFALVPYVPEVSGHGNYSLSGSRSITLVQTSTTYVPFLKLPVSWLANPADRTSGPQGQVGYRIDYIYASATAGYTRRGSFELTVDVVNKNITLSDEYDFTVTGSLYSTTLDFKAGFVDNTGTTTLTNPWTILISYQNTTPSDQGAFTYTYTSVF